MKKDDFIFDLKKIDDLPEKMQKKIIKKIKKPFQREIYKNILDLFETKKILSVDEIMVGLYRKYKIEKSRQSIVTILHNLKNKEFIFMDASRDWRKK